LCICPASYNTIKKEVKRRRCRYFPFSHVLILFSSPPASISNKCFFIDCLCIYVCGLFDYKGKKKEMQAKLNRLHTKNKEREKKKWWQKKIGPCGEWCKRKQLLHINIALNTKDKQQKTMNKIYIWLYIFNKHSYLHLKEWTTSNVFAFVGYVIDKLNHRSHHHHYFTVLLKVLCTLSSFF
jgi:hypothetical protein